MPTSAAHRRELVQPIRARRRRWRCSARSSRITVGRVGVERARRRQRGDAPHLDVVAAAAEGRRGDRAAERGEQERLHAAEDVTPALSAESPGSRERGTSPARSPGWSRTTAFQQLTRVRADRLGRAARVPCRNPPATRRGSEVLVAAHPRARRTFPVASRGGQRRCSIATTSSPCPCRRSVNSTAPVSDVHGTRIESARCPRHRR